ncbi:MULTISPECIES: T9SS type A sorting domain-containing protein [unclassified Carboxylicivirga]|uniref:T9SS type A sorting domain-containing protein n=1 Tax=Carboxylicivirga TaxID=1628153 RepID=UPI003D347C56
MKKFFTLTCIFSLLLSVSAWAQTDITPARYKFNNLPVGPFSLDKANPGANPPNGDPDVMSNWNDGFITACNGNLNSLTTGQGGILNSYFQILDMGGDVGKVLCMKGSGSTFPHGVAGDDGFWLGWWNLAFYTDKDLTPSIVDLTSSGLSVEEAEKQATVRMRVVFHIHQNELTTTNKLFDVLGYTYSGNHKTVDGVLTATQEFKSGDCASQIVDPVTFLPELTYDDTKWIACEYDFVAKEVDGAPLRFTFRFGGNAKNTTLLIKELTFTANPSGEPIENQELTLVSDPVATAINDLPSADELKCYGSNGELVITNADANEQVEVYALSGQLISSRRAGQAQVRIPLTKGLYIVRVGTRTAKVAVK